MRKLIASLVLLASQKAFSQRVVFDKYQFQTVNENGAVRQAAELTGQKYYDNVNQNLEKVKINTATVVLAQTMIYESLANVNSALKNGKMVLQMTNTVERIVSYSNQMLDAAKDQPALILFTEQMANESKVRALRLVNDISGVILKEGSNVLMDYNARDELLFKVNQELQIMEGLAYGGYSAMMAAKRAGVLKQVIPFSGFIATDKIKASEIVFKYGNLKKQ
ncbi:MAG: hypothetical protein EOP45_02765 [Sphingobacteriaceae bacterium]|nr:MAG: hypothetical protein EOP45_02765 [Sphingobacteriaceae bacterium]